MGFPIIYGNREWNSAASGDPCDKRERNSEDDKHNDGSRGVEAFVGQKDGEGASIENEAADKDAIRGKMPGVICRL